MGGLTIFIIRHAEKPNDPKAPWPGPGLKPDGTADAKSLVIRGWQRAGAWAALFGGAFGGSDYLAPATIYAADPKQSGLPTPNPNAASDDDGPPEPSQRPYETVIPLAAKLKLKTVTRFALGDEQELVDAVLDHTGVALICWEHKAIWKRIFPALANGKKIPNLPKKWNGSRFDVVLRFTRSDAKAKWTFKQLFPQLLSGDSNMSVDKPIPDPVGVGASPAQT
jgi:hypothetical protein